MTNDEVLLWARELREKNGYVAMPWGSDRFIECTDEQFVEAYQAYDCSSLRALEKNRYKQREQEALIRYEQYITAGLSCRRLSPFEKIARLIKTTWGNLEESEIENDKPQVVVMRAKPYRGWS